MSRKTSTPLKANDHSILKSGKIRNKYFVTERSLLHDKHSYFGWS